jgi:hypothetical protein
VRGLFFERAYPWVGGVLVGGSYYFFLRHQPLPATASDLFAAMINLSGISVGFLATAQSIIFTLGRNRLMRQFQTINYGRYLVGYFLAAIHSALLFCIINAVCLVFKPAPTALSGAIAIALWAATATTTLLSYYRVIRILTKVFRSPA